MTAEIRAKCDRLDEMIAEFIAVRNNLALGKYEAPVAALLLFNLTIRNVDGVITLARTDLVLLPPALIIARAAFEASVKAAWIMMPADPFERETHWLAHLKSEESYLEREIKEWNALGLDAQAQQHDLNSFKEFQDGVGALLKTRGYNTDMVVPNFRDCLRLLGEERTYGLYTLLCQTAHSTHYGTRHYRSGLGTKQVIGEFVKPSDWGLPLGLCRFAFKTPAITILKQLGADVGKLVELIERPVVSIDPGPCTDELRGT
jgi:hypothetical protein